MKRSFMSAKWIPWGIMVALFILAINTGPRGGPTLNEVAPPFRADLLQGMVFDLKDHRGEVVVLDFWATWCPPCRRSLPAINKLYKHYKDDPKVWIGTVNKESISTQRLTSWMKRARLTIPVIRDSKEEVSRQYNVRSIPTLIVINPKGEVEHVQVGLPNLSQRGLVNHLIELVESAR